MNGIIFKYFYGIVELFDFKTNMKNTLQNK